MGCNDAERAFYFMITPFFYCFSALSASYIPNWIDNRFVLISSTLTTAIAAFMIGPSALLSIPDNIRNIAIGLGLQGLFMPVLSVVGGTEMS
jgi:hypothetical protein